MKDIRVRYAPSPTGYLHIGNARTALFNYLFAKNNGGKFIIRIEDTDLERNIEDGVESQLTNLKWLGLEWDESIDNEGNYGPYNQLQRVEEGLYQPFIDQLLEKDLAYPCFCSSEQLDEDAEKQKSNGEIPRYSGRCASLTKEEQKAKIDAGEEYSVRFRVPTDEVIAWDDIVKGNVSFNTKDISGDFNILKRNGIPTYNFAVVIDDALMKISHVLRGEDHISNTPKQIMLYNALNLEIPTFCHMTLIVNESGKKLSKRDTSIIQFISEYAELGYLPEAMFNFITLLGWSPGSEQEIFTKEELINIFDASRLSKSSAKFDVNKLTWINNQYIKALDEDRYLSLVKPFIGDNEYDDDTLNKICLLYKNEISYGAEINEVSSLFFKQQNLNDECLEFIKQEGVIETLNVFKSLLEETDSLNVDTIKTLIKQAGKDSGAKGKMLFMPIRIATTYQMHGPELPNTLEILGKEKVLEHLSDTISKI